MSFLDALLRALATALESVEEALDADDQEDGQPPLLSPAKKAERSWPTNEVRRDTQPWPPFLGHRKQLGGGR